MHLLAACQDIAKWQDKIKSELLTKSKRSALSAESGLEMRMNGREELQITGPIKAPIYKLK